uniref:Uncharacterized protein n=1 Tax=Amphora coffeiformis TaxID=265554 RepID=A0A7S3P9K9_9STRA
MRGSICSEEHMELQNFAYGLGSYSVAPETDKAEQGTRMEAELLMSLCSSPVRIEKSETEAISASESETSYLSDSSGSRRDTFAFVCPSFSLENPEMAMRRIKHNEKVRRSTNGTIEDDTETNGDIPTPALLLKRPLKVDDRDAYRLSTEAMARNLSRSMQKALDWRIQTWVHTLSLALVKKEKAMMKEGIPEMQMRTSLLSTSEARLLTTLTHMKTRLQVIGAGTGFRVLSNQIEGANEPISKKRRLSNDGSECHEQLYTVTHELTFDGVINLETPAGQSEVLLQIPGTIEGTFLRSESNSDKLQSVCLDVDTDFLAAMIEKSSRELIRETLTKAVEEESSSAFKEEEIVESAVDQDLTQTTPPTPMGNTPFTPAAVRAALITPRMGSESSSHDTHSTRFLLPIPDDFNDSTPSRISPQPKSPAFGSPVSHFTPQTPNQSDVFNAAAALVSPTLKEPADYHEVHENSPSLPMLVEVACREFHSD